jgi:hypothetical protein
MIGAIDRISILEKNATIIIEKYNNFARKVENFGLRNAGEMKPLLDVSGSIGPQVIYSRHI